MILNETVYCKFCDMRYFGLDVRTHQSSHPATAEGGPYLCMICGQRFHNSSELIQHHRLMTCLGTGPAIVGPAEEEMGDLVDNERIPVPSSAKTIGQASEGLGVKKEEVSVNCFQICLQCFIQRKIFVIYILL